MKRSSVCSNSGTRYYRKIRYNP